MNGWSIGQLVIALGWCRKTTYIVYHTTKTRAVATYKKKKKKIPH